MRLFDLQRISSRKKGPALLALSLAENAVIGGRGRNPSYLEPPHRSVRAILVHTALPSDDDTKSLVRIFMTYSRLW